MGVCLGNVSIDELQRRTGFTFAIEDRKILNTHIQDNATIDPLSDKFHIFDIPFTITVAESFSKELIDILQKYENITSSKEQLSIVVVKETEQEKEKRLKLEQEKQAWKDKYTNPMSIWNVKWHMLVPVIVNGKNCYYGCFINTYTTGRENIPDIIDGKAWIRKDEEGLHGTFTLYNPETDSDADTHPDWNYVIGGGFVTTNGRWIGHIDDAYFDETEFSIKDAIELRSNTNDRDIKEIHFVKIKN